MKSGKLSTEEKGTAAQGSQAEVPTQKKEETLTVTMDQLSKIVAGALSAAMGQTKALNPTDEPEEILPEDILPDPVPMYAPSIFYVMSGVRTKEGVNKRLPHGLSTIRFEFEATKMQRHGKEQSIQVISKYLVKTRQMLEALRSDVGHNVIFFEGGGKRAMEVDTRITKRTMDFLASLNQKDQSSITMEAKRAGFDVAKMKLADMRMQLAVKYAKDEWERDNRHQLEVLKNTIKETRMLQNEKEIEIELS